MNDPNNRVEGFEPDSFDLRTPLRRLRRVVKSHRWIAIGTCLLTVGLMITYIKLRPPEYEASVTVMSEADEDKDRQQFYSQWNIFRKDDASSEPQLLTGGAVLASTLVSLDLTWDEVYHPIGSQFRHWWKGTWLGKQYRDVKQSLFPSEPSEFDVTPEEEEFGDMLVDFSRGVRFDVVEKTLVGKIVVRGPTQRVAEVANTIADTYLVQRGDRFREEASTAYDTLTEQVDESERRVNQLRQAQQDYREQNEIYLDFEKEIAAFTQWTSTEMEIIEKRAAIVQARRELEVVEQALADEPEMLQSSRTFEKTDLRQTIEASLITFELARLDEVQRYHPDEPEVRDLDEKIADLQRRLDEQDELSLSSQSEALSSLRQTLRDRQIVLRTRIAGLDGSLSVLEAAYDDFATNLSDLPRKQRELHQIAQELEIAWSVYHQLVAKQASALVSMTTAGSTAPSIKITEYARPPGYPTWPKTKLLLPVAVLIGLLLGIGAAWTWDMLDNRVRRHHLESGRGEARYYGSLPSTTISPLPPVRGPGSLN